MEGVNKAIPSDHHGPKTLIDPDANAPTGIYTRIADNFVRVNDMLNGEKAKEYGNPRTMFQNISKQWFGCADAEVDVAIMMAELKIERIKYDPKKEDSYLDAIAYLSMALAFMQEGEKNDNRNATRRKAGREEWRRMESGESGFILRGDEAPSYTVPFIFTDAFTGTHPGNAIILSETPFGDYEASPWTWSMFTKPTGMTVQELKERFPSEANMENPSACAMYLYEINPISDKELSQRLCDE